jgi:myosin heavy subunit
MNGMPTIIDEILTLNDRVDRESSSHLENKLRIANQIKELTQEEKNLIKGHNDLESAIKDSITIKTEDKKPSEEITKLISTITELETEIIRNQHSLKDLETELTRKKTEQGILVNKIEMMKNEKEDLIDIANKNKIEQSRIKKTSMKVKNEQDRLLKLRKQIERQEEVKKNLEAYFYTLNLIERIIVQNSSLTQDKEESEPITIPKEVQELIIKGKAHFDEAETKFSVNDLTPFLLEANRAYQAGIKGFILICDRIPDDLTEAKFIDQVLNLVDHGLMLNTRHLNAVDSMLQKLDKGVEIAPLASFANEVYEYFTENLTLLRIANTPVKF